MKSRVERYKELHEKIDNTVDDTVVNDDLSNFANRLNMIDNQFERMDVKSTKDHAPVHAREEEKPFEKTEPKEKVVFDTFENEYLKDFLEEVKAYNVEKGYRDSGDTETNILRELNLIPDTDDEPVDRSGSLTHDSLYVHDEVVEPEVVKQPEPITSNPAAPHLDTYLDKLDPHKEENTVVEYDFETVEEVEEPVVDIAKEVLAMTQELDIISDGIVENDVLVEDEDFITEEELMMKDVREETEEIQVNENLDLGDLYDNVVTSSPSERDLEVDDEITEGQVYKYRTINAIVNVLLIALIFGLAILAKYLLNI